MGFKIGDIVYDTDYGIGSVIEIKDFAFRYPIIVSFSEDIDDEVSYTLDGRYYIDNNRTLFHASEQDTIYNT